MRVARGASNATIDGSCRHQSVACHPDKNKSEEAKAQFTLISQVKNLLKNQIVSKVYDRFGLNAVNLAENDITLLDAHFAMELLFFYVFSLAWISVMSLFVQGRVAFWRSIRGLFLLLLIETSVVFGEQHIPVWLSPYYTSHETITFMHVLFPFYMYACSFFVAAATTRSNTECNMDDPSSTATTKAAAADEVSTTFSMAEIADGAVGDSTRRSSRQKQQKEQQVKKQVEATEGKEAVRAAAGGARHSKSVDQRNYCVNPFEEKGEARLIMANSAALLCNGPRPAVTRAQCAIMGTAFAK